MALPEEEQEETAALAAVARGTVSLVNQEMELLGRGITEDPLLLVVV
jgi:hypothetical protein